MKKTGVCGEKMMVSCSFNESLSILALRLIALPLFLSLSVYTQEKEHDEADERENAKCILNSLPLSFFPSPPTLGYNGGFTERMSEGMVHTESDK